MDHAQRTRRQQEIRAILAQVAIPVGIRPETAEELRKAVEERFARELRGEAAMPSEHAVRTFVGVLQRNRPELFQPPNSELSPRQKMELGRGLHPAVNDSLS